MSTNPTITFLIGAPGSGKTTFRNTIADAVVISSDDLIEQLAADHGITYREAFFQADMRDIERQMLATLGTALLANRDVVIDRTNMTRTVRAKLLCHVPSNYRRIAKVFRVDRDELVQRVTTRGQQTGKLIAAEVIDLMLERYDEPTNDEFEVIS